MTIKFELEATALRADIKRLGDAWNDVLEVAVMAAAEVIEDAARGKAPGPNIDTELESSERGRAEAHVGPDADHWYYKFAETGAQAHAITAQNARALKFVTGDFRKSVFHPGFAARPFLRPAKDQAGDAARRKFAQRLEQERNRVS